MSDLVIIEENNVCTTSFAIAEGTGNQHKNVLAMIRKHRSHLNDINPLAFKTLMGKPLPQGGYSRPTEVAMLSEQQATFLMTLLRNSPRVVQFKFDLVDAFFKARDLLMTGQMGLLQKHAILTLALSDIAKGYRWLACNALFTITRGTRNPRLLRFRTSLEMVMMCG